MKKLFTLCFLSSILVSGYSQRESPSDMSKELPRILINVGTVAFPKTESRTTAGKTDTGQDYQRLISAADDLYVRQQYDAAAAYYNMALDRKDEQYPKDQLLRIEAQSARAQQDQAEQARQQAANLELKRQDQAGQARRQAADLELERKHSVHFSGILMNDNYAPRKFSKINEEDMYSNFLQPGKYDTIQPYVLKANTYTFDGMAVPPGIRVIVYRELNCKGEVLLDVTGPAVINNMLWKEDLRFKTTNDRDYQPELQDTYPPAVRSWSNSNMHLWGNGSMEIILL